MRTRLPERTTDPSTRASTPNSARNLGSGLVRARISHGRRMRDHAERTDLGQVRGEFVGYAVGEKLLTWVGGKIGQRKHRNGPDWMRAQEVARPTRAETRTLQSRQRRTSLR